MEQACCVPWKRAESVVMIRVLKNIEPSEVNTMILVEDQVALAVAFFRCLHHKYKWRCTSGW